MLSIKIEEFTATASQSLFTLTTGTYDNTIDGSLIAFVDGVAQFSGAGLTLTSNNSFTLDTGLTVGANVIAWFFESIDAIQGIAGASYTANNIIDVASSRELALTDASKFLKVTTGATLTVPPNSSVAFATGDEIIIYSATASDVIIAEGLGVTINSLNGYLKIGGQYGAVTLKRDNDSADVWHLVGSLKD